MTELSRTGVFIEIFNKYGIKGSFHLNGGRLGQVNNPARPRHSADEIKDVYAGHKVSCHESTHPFFEQIAQMELIHEILPTKLCSTTLRQFLCGLGQIASLPNVNRDR